MILRFQIRDSESRMVVSITDSKGQSNILKLQNLNHLQPAAERKMDAVFLDAGESMSSQPGGWKWLEAVAAERRMRQP